MPKTNSVDEVQVLRFFETGPIEKAEVVFNIVTEKMRERLRGHHDEGEEMPSGDSGAGRKRSARRQLAQSPVFERSEDTGPEV